jgi:hypothetical protein
MIVRVVPGAAPGMRYTKSVLAKSALGKSALAWGGLLIGLGGCAIPASPQSHTDRATLAACRDYANRVYDRNNRGDIYSINQVGLPYSSSYMEGSQTNSLAAQYGNQRLIDNCVRNTGPETGDDTPPTAPSTAAAPARP